MTLSKYLLSSVFIAASLGLAPSASAFCGFYVAKADTDLFNQSSKVALVRDGNRTVITMANDYQGDPREFAMVIPVPTVIEKDQVHISDPKLLTHLDAYTAPRLVEYFDRDPCQFGMGGGGDEIIVTGTRRDGAKESKVREAEVYGVTIEDSFTKGEYDILILSATQSDGLQTWLSQNGYKVPDGAAQTLGSYIKQDMKFFVAKVNLKRKAKSGREMLRPIAVAYESPKFMLPIRLGTVNANGPQDLFVYALTRNGKVETTNYRTHKIPSGEELPIFVKDDFGKFYKDMYATSAGREGGHGVFMEYAWDMNWCDPCAADPLSEKQLQELGVFWLKDDGDDEYRPRRRGKSMARDVFVTRLHVRYDAESFPEDLKFKTTGDRSNFQGRYILRHAFDGKMKCPAADEYVERVNTRKEKEIQTLANMTGWDKGEIRQQVIESRKDGFLETRTEKRKSNWWKKIWGD